MGTGIERGTEVVRGLGEWAATARSLAGCDKHIMIGGKFGRWQSCRLTFRVSSSCGIIEYMLWECADVVQRHEGIDLPPVEGLLLRAFEFKGGRTSLD